MNKKEALVAVKRSVLVIDDDPLFIQMLRERLARKFEFLSALEAKAGLKILSDYKIDVAFIDLSMEGSREEGLRTLELARAISPETTYVMLTATNTAGAALKAIRLGARDYVVKSRTSQEFDTLVTHLHDLILEHIPLAGFCPDPAVYGEHFGVLIGESDEIRKIRHDIAAFVKGDISVLITGESGTGKEVVAQALHKEYLKYTGKPNLPFTAVNVAEVEGDQLRSSLFGHVKGSFTGAHRDRDGYFRSVGEGTLFLDEIGELPLDDQSKLLRVLQFKRATPLGSEKDYQIRCRIHFATNRDLAQEVEQNHFREDLYFRISAFQIHLPPLRSRKEDISHLATHFIRLLNKKHKRNVTSLSNEAINRLLDYDWPGNIRELFNVVERGYILERRDATCLELKNFKYTKKILLGQKIKRASETLNRYLEAFHANGQEFVRAAKALDVHEASIRKPLRDLFTSYPKLKHCWDEIPADYYSKKFKKNPNKEVQP